jgi:hypothetical protein
MGTVEGPTLAGIAPVSKPRKLLGDPAAVKRFHDQGRTLAAPIIKEFSDPTKLVYDDDYLAAYEVRNQSIFCGDAAYEIVTPGESIWVFSGLDQLKLGRRFLVEDLLKFLQVRCDNPHFEQVFPVKNIALLQHLRDDNYGWDPWLSHLRDATSLLGESGYKPAIPILEKLATNDPDARVVIGAYQALGRLARRHSEVIKTLLEAYRDPQRRDRVTTALEFIGGPEVAILVEKFDDDDPVVRKQAIDDAGSATKEIAVKALCFGIQYRRTDVQDECLRQLSKLGEGKLSDAVPYALLDYLRRPDCGQAGLAVELIARCGSAAWFTETVLQKRLSETRDPELQEAIRKAVNDIRRKDIGADPPAVFPKPKPPEEFF